jgi:hypothetical protein
VSLTPFVQKRLHYIYDVPAGAGARAEASGDMALRSSFLNR